MKKLIIILFLCGFLFFTGCERIEKENLDLSKYSFTQVAWTRDNGDDIETIKFNSDGSFSYYCSCGNPVNNADLCEQYTYNDKTGEIKLDCLEIEENTIRVIKIVNSTDDILELDFNGEVRKFKKMKEK